MSRRWRIVAFGSAGILVLAGALCAVVVGGLIGQLLTFVLIAVGLCAAVLLGFLEIGFSEDRERARDAKVRAEARATADRKHPPLHRLGRLPRRRG